jgi:hypothetical protein
MHADEHQAAWGKAVNTSSATNADQPVPSRLDTPTHPCRRAQRASTIAVRLMMLATPAVKGKQTSTQHAPIIHSYTQGKAASMVNNKQHNLHFTGHHRYLG